MIVQQKCIPTSKISLLLSEFKHDDVMLDYLTGNPMIIPLFLSSIPNSNLFMGWESLSAF